MEQDPKPTPQKPSKVEPKVQTVAAVFGDMVDPHTGRRFTAKPEEAGKITGWMQSQIDAKKLVLA